MAFLDSTGLNHLLAKIKGLTDKLEPTITTLPVSKGGLGRNTLTSGQAIIGNGTSAPTFRAITAAPASGSASLFTAGGAYNMIPKFSATEVNTGMTWIDGKTIYRKVISGSSGSAINTDVVIGTIGTHSEVTKVSGVLKTPSGNSYAINFASTQYALSIFGFIQASGDVNVNVSSDSYINATVRIIVEYTK